MVGVETDRFGRTLADLVVDGRSTTEALIAEGHGMGPETASTGGELMKQAAADGLGLWGDRCGLPATADLIIGDTMADPDGRDEERLVDEWVEIVNVGPTDRSGGLGHQG